MKISSIIAMCLLCASCVTTALYGNKFTPVEEGSDSYTLKIFYGGPSQGGMYDLDFKGGTAERLKKEADKFIKENPNTALLKY